MKKFLLSTITIICCIPSFAITTNAAEIDETSSNAVIYSEGLISSYRVSISASGKTLYLSGSTCCTTQMGSVGITDIQVQYSSDNVNWHNYTNSSDLLKSNSRQYTALNSNIGTVTGGYYYRVTCKHYAKESGLFGSSESISNTSNSVWIS